LNVGPYQLDRRFTPTDRPTRPGAAAPGETWSATGPDGDPVFLKFGQPAAQARGISAQRFAAEVAVAERLRHPGLPCLVAQGTTVSADSAVEAGVPWAAFQAVDGQDLSHHTRPQHRLPWTLVAALGARAADALHHAHRHGVLHRDLTPSNLVWSPARDMLVVIDFGLARDTAGDDDLRTATGVLPGTMGYVAPEVLAGGLPTVASDLFSLGVALFELLACRRPWEADSLGALFRAQAQSEPPLLADLVAGLPPGLCGVVHGCLRRNPDDRPVSASALASALRGVCGAAIPPDSASMCTPSVAPGARQ
jgi:eukaryotic-like serine/threonine-protein kinase